MPWNLPEDRRCGDVQVLLQWGFVGRNKCVVAALRSLRFPDVTPMRRHDDYAVVYRSRRSCEPYREKKNVAQLAGRPVYY